MTILVPYSPGGSFDIHARWLARHLPKHTGAKVIVQNVPGAGGVIGYNKLYNLPADGLTLLTAHTKLIAFDLFGRKGVRYDFEKFIFLGRIMTPDTALVIRKDLPSNLGKLRKMDRIRVGASSPFYEGLWAEALRLPNISVVPGYGGFSGRIAAIMRGELEATTGSVTGALKFPDAVKILVSVFPDKRLPDAPDLEKRNAAQPWKGYLESFAGLMRLTITSPGVPEERSHFLQSALRSVVQDKKALKEATRLKLQVKWVGPSKLKEQVKVFTKLSAEQRKQLKNIIERKYVRVPK
ncbi:MAG: hypothetical protein ACE5JU_18675 [Candidatus Binatia bacterium]